MGDHGADSGDCNNLSEPQEKPQALANSLYDGPLDHIIRKHPELFVNPCFWTRRHAGFLHVSYKEEKRRLCLSRHPHLTNTHDQHGDSIQNADIPSPQPKEDENILRVPSFTLPYLATPSLNSRIDGLSTKGNVTSSVRRLPHMESLLVWKKPRKRIVVSRTLMKPKVIVGKSLKNPNRKSNNEAENPLHRLKVKRTPLSIKYSKRSIIVVPDSQTYTLVKDISDASRHSWRLVYLDRSQLDIKRWARRQRKRQTRGNENFIDAEDDAAEWSPNEGRIAGLFIAMAQQRRREIEEEQQAHQSAGANPPEPQLQVRYQILLTDNKRDRACIYLYTAYVSDFLLEHFRTPAHLPQPSQSERNQPLLKIHRTMIPFSPYMFFRARLRKAIMDLANGTVGGFFPDVKSQPTPEQHRQKGEEILRAVLGLSKLPDKSTGRSE